ncbi:hypothetical protein AA313_de0205935 [Arthrobotrys entomopaga]|nr:hypothetical protein AA313_de0205935 [Arthrobotrys entomopaga]
MDRIIVYDSPGRGARTRTARPYLKVKEIEIHKDFILQKWNAGAKHKEIIKALKSEKNFLLRPYNLKRLLEVWNVSAKSLTKKRKLYVRNAIRERQLHNKQAHRVRFERSGRELTQEEMNEIMGATDDIFQGMVPSPAGGDIILSTPTPGEDNDIYENYDDNPDISEATIVMTGVSMADGAEAAGSCERREDDDLDYWIDIDDADESIETPVFLAADTAAASPSSYLAENILPRGITSVLESEEPNEERDVPVILERLCENAAREIQNLGRKLQTSTESRFESEPQSPQEFWNTISQKYMPELNNILNDMVRSAENFQSGSEPLNTNENDKSVPVDYNMALWAQGKKRVTIKRDISEAVIAEFYGVIGQLWSAIGSDDATFTDFEGYFVFREDYRQTFRELVIHLPYLLSIYGITHRAVVGALFHFNMFVWLWNRKKAIHSDTLVKLAELLVDIYSLFEASANRLRLVQFLIHAYETQKELQKTPQLIQLATGTLRQ